MLLSRRHLHALSRDPAVLIRAILITFGVFFLGALWMGVIRPPVPVSGIEPDHRAHEIRHVLKAVPLDRAALLRVLRTDARHAARMQEESGDGEDHHGSAGEPAFELAAWLAASTLPAAEQEAFAAWHAAILHGKATPELISRLESLAMPAAPGLPGTMVADLKRMSRDFEGALAQYEAAGAGPDGAEARRRAVDLALSREWHGITDRLLAQPAYYEAVHAVSDPLAEDVARYQLDIPVLTRQALVHLGWGFQQTPFLLLSLLTGTVWFISLHKACRLPRRKWWISLAGVGFGVFSIVLTLVLLDLQQARNGLNDSELAGPALLFQIASVGLREEGAKLICVLPLLLLVLLRKGTPAQALMVASCVGLGFAVEENISYYARSAGSGVLGRFLTANFMHLAMTGLTGHALFRFLRYPRNYGPNFIATFTGMVLLHGFYNFSGSGHDNPFSRELSTLFPFLVAGLGYYYFQTIRHEQEDAPQILSAHAVFLLGTTVIMGTLLNFLVWENGWGLAIHAFVPAALSYGLFCWLFTHLLRDV